MKAFVWMSLLVFSMSAFSATEQKRVLSDPTGETIFWVFHHLANLEPDMAPIVKLRMQREPGVNEFNRAEKELVHEKKLQAEYATAVGYSHIELNLSSNVSAYDATYQEYYLNGLGPGSYVSYRAYGKQFQVRLTNAEDGSVWAMPPDKAEAIAGLMGPSRRVSLRLYLEILGTTPTSSGGEIEARILSFKIYTTKYGRTGGRKIGEIVLVDQR